MRPLSASAEQSLLLAVWQEIGRHLEVGQSLGTIAGVVAGKLPIDRFTVVSIDLSSGTAVTLDTESPFTAPCARSTQILEKSQRAALSAWEPGRGIVKVTPARHARGITAALSAFIGGAEGDWRAGPLGEARRLDGVLLTRWREPPERGSPELRALSALLQPLTAALHNDRRLAELQTLREAAEAERLRALQRLGRENLEDHIIGADGGLAPVLARVDLISKSDMPVLILGETGTGKEIIARAIHQRSQRASGPFIRVNCGAIAPDLIDSELFGHEKGAFTGAVSGHRGWFERANHGTLLLDEIGELSAGAQVRLLRVLQEGTFERVGGEASIRCDVRIISATHRDLPAMVQNGRFREDLWYRIAAFPILLPPLRERKMDIPALAEHFAERAARHFGLRPQKPTPADLALLSGYDWPGNIREFAAVIDRAAILGDGDRLDIERALGSGFPAAPAPSPSPVRPAAGVSPAAPPSPPVMDLDEAMRQTIEQALVLTRGRIEGPHGAGAVLRINPHTLRARMRKLGIDWRRFRVVT